MGRVLAAVLLLAGAALGDSLLDRVRATRKARLSGDNKTWLEEGKKVLALAPQHPDLLVSVARAQAANGNFAESLELLKEAIDRGAGVDLARVDQFKLLPPLARPRRADRSLPREPGCGAARAAVRGHSRRYRPAGRRGVRSALAARLHRHGAWGNPGSRPGGRGVDLRGPGRAAPRGARDQGRRAAAALVGSHRRLSRVCGRGAAEARRRHLRCGRV